MLQHLQSLIERREVWGADDQGTGQSLAEYLEQAEQKYTAESKVADLITLQQFLHNRIEIESKLVDTYNSDGAPACFGSIALATSGYGTSPFFEWLRARNDLLESIVRRESVVKKIKFAFHQQNSYRPSKDRFSPPSSSEIRQKLRVRSGAPAAVAAGVAAPTSENWHVRKGQLQELIQKRLHLVKILEKAQANLMKMREQQHEYAALDVVASALVSDVPSSTSLSPANFDRYNTISQHYKTNIHHPPQLRLLSDFFSRSYCADLVSKRLHHDVMPLIEAMRAGFNLVSPSYCTKQDILLFFLVFDNRGS